MIRSMTGYGRAQGELDGLNIVFEIKSVNHKFFEFSSRTPRVYGFLDEKLKSYVQSRISRGKVESFIQIEALDEAAVTVRVNHALAKGYIEAFRELEERYGLKNDVSVSVLARYGEVFSVHKEPEDEERVWNAVRRIADEAMSAFVAMRETEGGRLAADILSRADAIIENVGFIEERSPETVREYNERVAKRIAALLDGVNVDEQRLLTEAAVFADKVAVDEETVRLRSHISQLRGILAGDGAVGRKLDFLVQEINREANTIGSKSQDVAIANRVIAIKAEVEKIREQIQNIE